MHSRVWQLHVRPGRVQDLQDVFSSVVDLARQNGDTEVFSRWPPVNRNHRM